MLELLRKRRSIRRYEPRALAPETVDRLVEALLRSPTSKNNRPWHFVVVDDPDLLKQLSEAKPHGAALLADAPLAIVVCADPGDSDVWIEDASIASIVLQLTAQSLGLGSCWVQIRRRLHADGRESEAYVRETLGIPENLRVLSIIAVGYPAESKAGHDESTLLRDRIHITTW